MPIRMNRERELKQNWSRDIIKADPHSDRRLCACIHSIGIFEIRLQAWELIGLANVYWQAGPTMVLTLSPSTSPPSLPLRAETRCCVPQWGKCSKTHHGRVCVNNRLEVAEKTQNKDWFLSRETLSCTMFINHCAVVGVYHAHLPPCVYWGGRKCQEVEASCG